ncbi:MAG: hypothetical protein ACTH8F_00350 [Microbacterium sp.]|uniref:hypothetical protein n=1 Tax=Microbacterium sp. TaxID=51671 RepID=UPI003F9AF63C
MSTTSTYPPTALTWKQADDNVHVATRDGEFAGFIEADGTKYVVHDSHGSDLGTFSTLVEARRGLDGSPRRTTRSIRQTLGRHLSRARA